MPELAVSEILPQSSSRNIYLLLSIQNRTQPAVSQDLLLTQMFSELFIRFSVIIPSFPPQNPLLVTTYYSRSQLNCSYGS